MSSLESEAEFGIEFELPSWSSRVGVPEFEFPGPSPFPNSRSSPSSRVSVRDRVRIQVSCLCVLPNSLGSGCSNPGKRSQNAPRHPPEMPSGGLWRPSRETTLGHPGKSPKRIPSVNKSIPSIAWGIARGNEGLRTSTTTAQSPSHSLSHPLKGMASQQLQLAPLQRELP